MRSGGTSRLHQHSGSQEDLSSNCSTAKAANQSTSQSCFPVDHALQLRVNPNDNLSHDGRTKEVSDLEFFNLERLFQ